MKQDIHHICTTLEDMYRLMEELVALQRDNRQCCRAVSRVDTVLPPETEPGDPVGEHYKEDDLMTIKEAAAYLKVSRFTIDAMRRRGQLTSLIRNRRVRLLRVEVDKAFHTYSLMKGKV